MRYLLFFFSLLIAGSSFARQYSDSMYITTSDSTRLFVKRSGKGTPVLFIHGGPGSNSYYFEKEGGNIFEKEVQMIYLDQRGCGRSDTARNHDYSLSRVIKDFDEVRKALGYSRWILMPHSFGGILATEYATEYPETVRAMVYLNCTVNLFQSARSGISRTIEILGLQGSDKEYLLNDTVPLLDRWGNAFWHLRNRDQVYAIMFDKKESYKLDSSLMAQPFLKFQFGSMVWNYPEYFRDFAPKTANLKMPVLVVAGSRDYTIGLDHPKLFQFPQMQLKTITGGHALYLEHRKALYRAVRPFLARFSGKNGAGS